MNYNDFLALCYLTTKQCKIPAFITDLELKHLGLDVNTLSINNASLSSIIEIYEDSKSLVPVEHEAKMYVIPDIIDVQKNFKEINQMYKLLNNSINHPKTMYINEQSKECK